jgi:hypothetical protein
VFAAIKVQQPVKGIGMKPSGTLVMIAVVLALALTACEGGDRAQLQATIAAQEERLAKLETTIQAPTRVPTIPPTAIPMPTLTPTARPTQVPPTTATDLRTLNWIDRELRLTGQLPLIPAWLVPLVSGAKSGDRVAKGQQPLAGITAWCQRLTPSQRWMYLEFVAWQGHNVADWLDYMNRMFAGVGSQPYPYYWLDQCPYARP